jgi:lysine/ornithine N-monooxygenase
MSQTINQQALEQAVAKFRREYAYAEAVLTYLKKDDVLVVRVERGWQGRWSLFCVLPQSTQEMFDISREVLLMATDYDRVEPRILNEMQRQLRDNARTDDQVAVLVSIDPGAERLPVVRLS